MSNDSYTSMRDKIGLKLLSMDEDIYINKNHISNLNNRTRYEKDDIWHSIHDLQQRNKFIQRQYARQLSKLKQLVGPSHEVPKLLWLYTEFNFTSEKMLEQLLGNHLIHHA